MTCVFSKRNDGAGSSVTMLTCMSCEKSVGSTKRVVHQTAFGVGIRRPVSPGRWRGKEAGTATPSTTRRPCGSSGKRTGVLPLLRQAFSHGAGGR